MSGQDTNPKLYKVGSRMEVPPLVGCEQCTFYRAGLSSLTNWFFGMYEDINPNAFHGECTLEKLPVGKGTRCDNFATRQE